MPARMTLSMSCAGVHFGLDSGVVLSTIFSALSLYDRLKLPLELRLTVRGQMMRENADSKKKKKKKKKRTRNRIYLQTVSANHYALVKPIKEGTANGRMKSCMNLKGHLDSTYWMRISGSPMLRLDIYSVCSIILMLNVLVSALSAFNIAS